MPRKRRTIEQAAYAAVGAADAAGEVLRDKVVDLKAATKKARRRTSSAITDAEQRGRSTVRKIRKAGKRSTAARARPKTAARTTRPSATSKRKATKRRSKTRG
jgi:hypothetical protein